MRLSEISDHEHLTALMINKLISQGKKVYMSILDDRWNTYLQVPVEEARTVKGWIQVEYGLTSDRSSDIIKWETYEFDPDTATLEKNDQGEWWIHEAD